VLEKWYRAWRAASRQAWNPEWDKECREREAKEHAAARAALGLT
jgi:hypothetical protein